MKKRKRLLLNHERTSPILEELRILRTNIQLIAKKRNMKTILVTSTNAQEGKSTITANLAGMMGEQDLRILIIDADLRLPSQHHILQQDNYNGLTDILRENIKLVDAIQPTSLRGVDVITAGTTPYNPSELLSKHVWMELLHGLKQQYDYILVDAPPAPIVDSQIIASKVDGTILVIEENKTKTAEFNRSLMLLTKMDAYMIGVILNKTKRKKTDGYYYKKK
ncbi:CpsD/CapB family tyrosine-protein kinase [Listeria booriae]|uniref:CpsD/CapB family tyrosine-protein kinase n=1 Tax=Listeria booriae TaxID=1552123 RepID=A0A841XVP7_9LIST|nr:CpsD/CapB family tyrosine-protein kinase [Listeria booriae]MBC1371321.1 CpsD/CapB family tyrosine-protein kinase [Listeria booriae]MBC2676737.1 CpsD/CapB family tyrosine-protein kinase [Listeria booriae]